MVKNVLNNGKIVVTIVSGGGGRDDNPLEKSNGICTFPLLKFHGGMPSQVKYILQEYSLFEEYL